MNNIDYINPEQFEKLCHFSIYLKDNKNWTNDILKRNAIIYCHPDDLNVLFFNIQFSSNKYIIVTSGSDIIITKKLFDTKPNCIIKWYGVNVEFEHPDLTSVPYGLSPNEGYAKTIHDINFLVNAKTIDTYRNITKDMEVLYCNFAWQNNPKDRSPIKDKLIKSGVKFKWQRDFRTAEDGTQREDIPFPDYINNLSSHKFIIAPPGNSPESHRVWESLYVNSIPIVLKHHIWNCYSDELPIIRVNDYSELTYDLLYSYLDKEYNMRKLYLSYWKEKILTDFNKL
jgi:hypothetical protein